MEKIAINPLFILTAEEVGFLSELTPKMAAEVPKISAPEVRQLGNIFYRVFASQSIGKKLLGLEQKEKLPNGKRPTTMQAQYNILHMLRDLTHRTGLHENITAGYILGAISNARNSVVQMLPMVLDAIQEEGKPTDE